MLMQLFLRIGNITMEEPICVESCENLKALSMISKNGQRSFGNFNDKVTENVEKIEYMGKNK